jgi:hypothetical protein
LKILKVAKDIAPANPKNPIIVLRSKLGVISYFTSQNAILPADRVVRGKFSFPTLDYSANKKAL